MWFSLQVYSVVIRDSYFTEQVQKKSMASYNKIKIEGYRMIRNPTPKKISRIRWMMMSEKSRYTYLWARTVEHL
jgi:hypothetical protein